MARDNDEEASESGEENVKKYIHTSDDLKDCGWGDKSLREYQLDGVNWLIERYNRGHGCILGDEMGLGKTCQTIALIAYIHSQSKKNLTSLVVCPRSVLENWQAEFKMFAPGMKTQMLIGEKEAREDLIQQIKVDKKNGRHKFDVMLTTYEICIRDATFLKRFGWHLLVVDEAHRLKNHNSLLYRTLTEWRITVSILLTGTPVQNNLQELYALLSFVNADKFQATRLERFVEKFSDMEKSDTAVLHRLLQPYLLRRTKAAVLKDLPRKSEVVLTHGISKLQAKLYKGILTKDLDVFETVGSGGGKQQSLMNILMQLRKCVNHPYLFDGVEPEPFLLGDHLVEASGKLVLIDKLLKYLKSTGHKVLLFSQMTHMLDILQDYLGYRGYSYERLDGSVRGEERFLAIQNFNQTDDTFVFLLSTKAGGQGINLSSADTVIFVDSDFNPQNDLQAAARAHRIGQTRPVKVMRLIAKHTVEEIILKRAEDKLKLTEKVIEEGQFSLGANKDAAFTDGKVKLQDILKFGMNKLFGDGDDSESQETSEIDFVKLLGPTAGDAWQEVEDKDEEEEEGETEDVPILEGTPQSMYVFEGKDYSKEPNAADQKVFEELIEAQRAVMEAKLTEPKPLRRRQPTAFMGGLPTVLRKPRKQLTPEELEDRKKKRKEAAEQRAKEAEEQELRRAQQQRLRREEHWKKHHYESCNVVMDSDNESDDDDVYDEEDDGAASRTDIHYVIGDATHPKDSDRDNNIVVHCADDSGKWGRGGLFTAIASRSVLPEEQYTLAGKMKDLVLGDCHLIPIDEKETRDKGNDWLGLIIAQHRDEKNHLSGIKLSALRHGLERIYKAAKEKKASVHLPRIGHDTPGFNWYGTEHLIKKHLAKKGIPTYIYYFPRKHAVKRKAATYDPSTEGKVQKTSDTDPAPSTSGLQKKPSVELLDIFAGLVIYMHKAGIADDDFRRYKRYIVAYDGDLDSYVSDETTHIVLPKDCDNEMISKYRDEQPGVALVTTEWLDDCLSRVKCLKTENYELS